MDPAFAAPLVAGGAWDQDALRRGLRAGDGRPMERTGLLMPTAVEPGSSARPAGLVPDIAVWHDGRREARGGATINGGPSETLPPAAEFGDAAFSPGLSGVVGALTGLLDAWALSGLSPSGQAGSEGDFAGPADGFDPSPAMAPAARVMAAASGGLDAALSLGNAATVSLAPGVAGQVLGVYLRNDGAALSVGGLDLKIRVTGAGSGPVLQGVDLRAGSLFTPANSMQGADAANSGSVQFWSVSINDPFAPPALSGGGATTLVGTISMSTVGVGPGTWTLSALLPETGLLGPFGDSLSLGVTGVTLQVIPEPGATAAGVGLGLGLWGLWRRRHGRDARA